MNSKTILAAVMVLAVCIFGASLLISADKQSQTKSSGGGLSDEAYVEIVSRMMYYDRVYRKKYQVVNPNPSSNSTAEGVANAYKYQTAMKKERSALLNKYGVSMKEFEAFNKKLDDGLSTPEGQDRQKRLTDRAGKRARALMQK